MSPPATSPLPIQHFPFLNYFESMRFYVRACSRAHCRALMSRLVIYFLFAGWTIISEISVARFS